MNHSFRLNCMLTLCLALVCATPPANASDQRLSGQIALSPQNFIIDLDEPTRVHSYRLLNQGQHPVRVALDLMSFELDENNQVVPVAPSETSLENWIVVNPLELEIPPGDSRVVRFSVRPAIPLPAGEHRALMVFQQVLDDEAARPPVDEDQAGLTFRTQFRIQSAIYATVGPIERSARIENLRLEADALWLELRATGNGHFRLGGDFALRPAGPQGENAAQAWRRWLAQPRAEREPQPPTSGEFRHGRLAGSPILPGTIRWLRLPLSQVLPPGQYRLEFEGLDAGQPLSFDPALLERPLVIARD